MSNSKLPPQLEKLAYDEWKNWSSSRDDGPHFAREFIAGFDACYSYLQSAGMGEFDEIAAFNQTMGPAMLDLYFRGEDNACLLNNKLGIEMARWQHNQSSATIAALKLEIERLNKYTVVGYEQMFEEMKVEFTKRDDKLKLVDEILVEALKFYATYNSYDYDKTKGVNYIWNDKGKVSCKALQAWNEIK